MDDVKPTFKWSSFLSSRSSASWAASLGKFVLIVGRRPAGMQRFPSCLRMRLKFDSPSMAVFGDGRIAKLSSVCSLYLDQSDLAK